MERSNYYAAGPRRSFARGLGPIHRFRPPVPPEMPVRIYLDPYHCQPVVYPPPLPPVPWHPPRFYTMWPPIPPPPPFFPINYRPRLPFREPYHDAIDFYQPPRYMLRNYNSYTDTHSPGSTASTNRENTGSMQGSTTRRGSYSETTSVDTETESVCLVPSQVNVEFLPQYRLIVNSMMSFTNYYDCNSPLDFSTPCTIFADLSCQIWTIHASSQLSMADFFSKMNVWKTLLHLAHRQSIFTYRMHLTGSTLSGLSVCTNNLNLCVIVDKRTYIPSKFDKMFHLKIIEKQLPKDKTGSTSIIPDSEPLLRFNILLDRMYKIDMICNNTVGLWNTKLVLLYTKCDWRFQPLSSIIKKWTTFYGLNAPVKKTFSSYSLTLLLIFFLQCGVSPAVLPCLHQEVPVLKGLGCIDLTDDCHEVLSADWTINYKSNNIQSLGELLIEFLKFYAFFDFKNSVISVRVGKPLKREIFSNRQSCDDLIFIQEPFSFSNVCGNICTLPAYEKVIKIFRNSHNKLAASRNLDSLFKN